MMASKESATIEIEIPERRDLRKCVSLLLEMLACVMRFTKPKWSSVAVTVTWYEDDIRRPLDELSIGFTREELEAGDA